MIKFVIELPRYGPRSKYAGQLIPLNSGNNYASPIVRRSRTDKHRRAARDTASAVRKALRLPENLSDRSVVHMTLVRGLRQRLLDTHQVYAGTKPYLDGLKDAKLIVDDKPKWCDFTASQLKDNKAGPVIIVQIWPVISSPASS